MEYIRLLVCVGATEETMLAKSFNQILTKNEFPFFLVVFSWNLF